MEGTSIIVVVMRVSGIFNGEDLYILSTEDSRNRNLDGDGGILPVVEHTLLVRLTVTMFGVSHGKYF
jgi:hypothetical protein